MYRKSMSVLCLLTAGFFSPYEHGMAKELVFTWGKAEDFSDISTKLKERAILSLLQENIRSRIEKALLERKISYKLQLEEKLLPSQFSIFFDEKDSGNVEELTMLSEGNLSSFLEEFDQIKTFWLDWTQKQRTASFTSSYAEFLDNLEIIFQEISAKDLTDYFHSKLHSENQELETFLALPLTETYQEMISSLIIDFANKTMIQLIADRNGMEERKEKLAVIHPLRHIGFLWSNPDLLQSVKRIRTVNFKWTRFMKGMVRAFKRHKEAGTLNAYVPGFADFLKTDRKTIQTYLDQDDYNGMFDYLLQL